MPETNLALAALKKQRSTNKAKLTNLVKYSREDHSDTSLSDLTTRLRRVEQLMSEFTDLEFRIFTENPEEESDLAYEENYYNAMSTLNKWIRAKNLNSGVVDLDVSHNATQNGEHSSQVKLPKIHIPSFAGDYSEWQSFYDMYTTTIHESPNLSPVQKFQYLKGLLRGEAAVLLRHINVTESNYIGALNKLKERYDRKKHIVNTFIRTFIEQPAIQQSTASNIKRIMDTSDEVIRGLKALGEIGEKRDPWLIYIILQKLDDKTKALWAEQSADIINPEFAEFLKFLGRRTDTLESLATTTKRTTPRSLNVRSHVVSEEPEEAVESLAALKPLNNYPCAMCQKEGHTIFYCDEFHSLDLNGRNEFIKGTNRCFNCFGTHSIIRCPSRRRCQKCRKKHNTLLHHEETKDDSQPTQPTTSNDKQVFHSQGSNTSAILPTAIVEVVDDYGRITPCRALLDSGSQASFITEGCAQRLRLKKRNARIPITGVGQSGSVISKGLVTINIKPNAFPEFSIETLVIPKITSQLPAQNLHIKLKTSSNLKLADPQFNKRSNIDVLIGADHFFDILQDGQIKTNVNEPVLQNTIFGWVVSGQAHHSTDDEAISMVALSPNEREMFNIDLSLRRFWELESVNAPEKIFSPEETFCENHFVKNMKRDPQGRFIVKLPFKEQPNKLGDSLTSAIQRLRGVERRLIRDPPFAKLYHDFMTEYQQLNHMIEVSPSESSQKGFYLPHHGVLKTTSITSKMRVVFDASAKSTTGVSLNNCLATGPNVQSSLYAIILRFRENKVAFSADVEKMYRQVRLSPDDTHYQKIVWRSNPSEAIRHFRLLTVTYGLSSASFLATRSINQVSKDNMDSSPQAARVIANDIYVDDLMSGADDEESAELLKNKIAEILTQYGFHLRKWKSNAPKILITAHHEPHELKHKEIQDRTHKDAETVKVLGVNWNHETDCFTFIAELPDATKFTKRTVLSEASRLFDPMGWLAPVVITFKIFMQMLWADSMDWDDPLPHKKHILWSKLRSNLKTINAISIPRFILTCKGSKIDLHGFCDASQYAYAAAVYFRIEDANGNISVHLISAKTKVAPIKQQTIPRLELCAAVLLANLIQVVKSETNMKLREIFAWTDSQIVLDWLGSHPRRWSTFIGNRTATILSNLSRKNWRHVPTANNPADCASRGMSPSELQSHALWWNGPDWLKLTSNLWPPQQNDYGHCEEESSKTNIFALTCTVSTELYDELLSRYSTFRKLQRVMGYIVRFISNSAQPKEVRRHGIYLHREELLHVRLLVCKHEQHQFYKDDIAALQSNSEVRKGSSIQSLDPFIDEQGLLRVGGRLQNSLASYSTKHPIIIHPKSRIAALVLRDTHLDNQHAGPSLLLSILRQEYWIPNGKMKAKETIKKCVTCTKFKAQCSQQLMGSLPSSRVELVRPFLKTGVDYAGPFAIRLAKGRGQKTYKAYICLFICLSIKAVHLELVGDLSSDAFLGALKRFTARRGVCLELYSDNGTNFVGSDRKLQQEFNKIVKLSNNISNYFSRNRITWHFIPPNSPHFGGLWEAAIKSTKFHIKRVIEKHVLTFEEMSTLLAEIEGILNSRPICVINNTEVDPLTPSHFLIGHPTTKIPEPDISGQKISHLTRWQMVQQMNQHFWNRWHIEYLTSLQQRTKWKTREASLQVDDIVLLKEKNVHVNQWILGRVTQLHPGSDGLVRVVTLKTRNNEMKRPIHKLCLLPVSTTNSNEA